MEVRNFEKRIFLQKIFMYQQQEEVFVAIRDTD